MKNLFDLLSKKDFGKFEEMELVEVREKNINPYLAYIVSPSLSKKNHFIIENYVSGDKKVIDVKCLFKRDKPAFEKFGFNPV